MCEIFHVFYQEKLQGKKVDFYMNEFYTQQEEDRGSDSVLRCRQAGDTCLSVVTEFMNSF